MKKYESAYGIAGFIIHVHMLHQLMQNHTITREEAITIIQNSKNFRKNFKPLPFDDDLLAYVDESLKIAEQFLLPLS